eukprot:GHVS01071953.1.p1 GENE.GHVS01071953.1~~GHVS01071953.1.p1  ORF type:complete len:437 (-),score=55.90 GHVS01071953.1:65-1213(-)
MFLLSRRSAVMLALSVILAFATTTLLAKISKEDALKLLEFCFGLTDVSHWYHKSMMNLAMANNGRFGGYVFSLTEGKDGCTLEEPLTGKRIKIREIEDASKKEKVSNVVKMQMWAKENVKALVVTGTVIDPQGKDSQDEDKMSVICVISNDNGEDFFRAVEDVETPVTSARWNLWTKGFLLFHDEDVLLGARTAILNTCRLEGKALVCPIAKPGGSVSFVYDEGKGAGQCRATYTATNENVQETGKEFRINFVSNMYMANSPIHELTSKTLTTVLNGNDIEDLASASSGTRITITNKVVSCKDAKGNYHYGQNGMVEFHYGGDAVRTSGAGVVSTRGGAGGSASLVVKPRRVNPYCSAVWKFGSIVPPPKLFGSNAFSQDLP